MEIHTSPQECEKSSEKASGTNGEIKDSSPQNQPSEKPDLLWAWWGDPWPSGICYVGESEGARVLEEAHVPVPVGEKCSWCEEVIQEGDQGVRQPGVATEDGKTVRKSLNVHKECQLRSVLGSMKHINHECSCYGKEMDNLHDYSRADALEVWEWAQTHPYGQTWDDDWKDEMVQDRT